MLHSSKLQKIKKVIKAYSLYACSLGFIMQSPSVLGLCLIAVLADGLVEYSSL